MQNQINNLPKLAKDKHKENKTFFTKLRKKPPKQLDYIMQELHEEEFERTDCLQCANCCKTTGPLFTDKDIQRISKSFKMKEQQFIENNTNKWSVENDARIEELMEKFAGTKLTTSERRQFESLKEHLTTLERIELKYRENSINNKTHVIPEIFKHIKNDLNDLAETQILESKSKMFLAQKSLNTTNLLSNLELGLLIIVGIAIQFVIFYRIKKTSYGSNLKTVD